MQTYNVHLYRAMRLFFSSIVARMNLTGTLQPTPVTTKKSLDGWGIFAFATGLSLNAGTLYIGDDPSAGAQLLQGHTRAIANAPTVAPP